MDNYCVYCTEEQSKVYTIPDIPTLLYLASEELGPQQQAGPTASLELHSYTQCP